MNENERKHSLPNQNTSVIKNVNNFKNMSEIWSTSLTNENLNIQNLFSTHPGDSTAVR